MTTLRIPQMKLVADIGDLLARKYGIKDVSARHVNAIIKAADLLVLEFGQEDRVAKAGAGLAAWIASDDVGLSSLCMARTLAPMAGLGPCPAHRYSGGINYPHDPDDLGRCIRLLDVVPALRPHIAKMAEVHPVWAAYVANWDAMEALYVKEASNGRAPELYKLMKRLQESAV